MVPSERPARRTLDTQALDLELIETLEKQSLEQIKAIRAYERLDVRLEVICEPANTTSLGAWRAEGQTRDLSRGGCRVLLSRPPMVGDVYRLRIDDPDQGLPMIFARCVRVALVRETSFDCSFSFFSSLEPKGLLDGMQTPA